VTTGVARRAVDPDARDIEAARGLLRRLYDQHEAGDNIGCHFTALEIPRYLRLVRLIVPQHPLWSVNPYRHCDFRCRYCSVHAQGVAVPSLTGDALRRRLRLELQVVPPEHHTVLSAMCDAYVPAEAHIGIARIAMEELIATGRCVHVVTKGATVLRDADLLRRARCGKVEVSLCTLDEGLAAALEPGAPPPAERLVLVRALAAAGVDVGISLAPWIPGVTDVGAVLDAVGPERRITISPLKCNAAGPTLELAGRRYTQQSVNGRYRQERERFRGCPSLRWESPWQFSNHYLRSYQPLTFGDVDGSIRSPEPEPRMAQRFLALLASHGVWHRVARVHAALYRASRGHIGRSAAGITYLLLITRGRRSGRPHTVPLPYAMDGPRWLVVASNGGADRDPAWLHNLRADTSATVQVGRARTTVTARVATTWQTRRLWPMLQSANPLLGRSQQLTARSLPVVILEPRGEAGGRRAST
jgi:deazaflavin-dependent oxidoreductase (nitroreductase family)